MENQIRPLIFQNKPVSQTSCPFRWSCQHGELDDPGPVNDVFSDSQYIQARRQGIYLAACIIDDVAALDADSPEAVIDEIRRRICELVRVELSGARE